MSLIHWWPFNNNTTDSITSLSLTGSATYSTGGKVTPNALKSTSTLISTTLLSKLSPLDNDFSFACWLKINQNEIATHFNNITSSYTVPTGTLIGYNNYGGTALIWKANSLTSFSKIYIEGTIRGNDSYTTPQYEIPFDKWVHITMVKDSVSKKIILYINGVEVKSTSIASLTSVSYLNQYISINRSIIAYSNGPATILPCYLNDVRVYDHALSPREIKLLSQGLVAHYKLDNIMRNLDPAKNSMTTHSLTEIAGATSLTWGTYFGHPCFKLDINVPSLSYWNGCYMSCVPINQGLQEGDIVTRSCKIYVPSGQSKPNHFGEQHENGGTNYNKVQYDFNKCDTWQTVSQTAAIASGTNLLHYFYASNPGDPAVQFTCYIRDFQLELNDHATDFVKIDPTINIYDCSGYCNHGTPSAILEASTDSPRYSHSTLFKDNKYINCGRGAMVTDELTVNWWGKMSDWSLYASTPMRALSCTDTGGWNFEPNSGKMCFAMGTGSTSNSYKNAIGTTTFESMADNSWHMFTGTYDGFTTKLYVDGKLEGENRAYSIQTPIFYNKTNNIYIGVEAGNKDSLENVYFTGNISDVRVYATALPAAAVKELYESSISLLDNGTLQCSEIVEKDTNIKYNQNGIVQTTNFNENTTQILKMFENNTFQTYQVYEL